MCKCSVGIVLHLHIFYSW